MANQPGKIRLPTTQTPWDPLNRTDEPTFRYILDTLRELEGDKQSGSDFSLSGTASGDLLVANGSLVFVPGKVLTSSYTVSGSWTVGGALAVSGAATVTGALLAKAGVGVSGAVVLGSTLGVSGLTTIAGALNVSGISTFVGVLRCPDGTLGAPGITFSGDPDTGFYRSAQAVVGWVGNGVIQAQIQGDGLVVPNQMAVGSTSMAGQLFVLTTDPARTALVVKGAALQASPLLDIQLSTGVSVAQYTAAGNLNLSAQLNVQQNSIFGNGTGDRFITLNGDTTSAILIQEAGSDKWQIYKSGGDNTLYIRDMSNGRTQITVQPGTAGNAATIFLDRVIVKAPASPTQNLQEWWDTSNNTNAYVSSIGAGAFFPRDAATTTRTAALILGHNSAGTPAVGFGNDLRFQLKSSTTEDQDAAGIRVGWQTATHASRAASGAIDAYYTTTARECIAWGADNVGPLFSVLGAPKAAQQTGGAATAGLVYTATEQGMLQAAYNALRTFGFLT